MASPPAPRANAPAQIDRILIGSRGVEAEARIRISTGPLAGFEIRLAATGAASVTAQLLTAEAGSRETLSVVVEEIRRRLRDRGITLDLGPGRRGETGEGRDDPPIDREAVDREQAVR